MLFKIAWRNIWRNKLRTSIVLTSLSFGIIVMVLISGYTNGIGRAFLKNSLNKQYGHVQIHNKKFIESLDIKDGFKISEIEPILIENKLNYSPRTKALGLISSAGKSQMINIIGIDTTLEKKVINPLQYQIEGNGFKGTKSKPLFMDKSLAQKLKVKLKSKVILTFTRKDGSTVRSKFKITGISNFKNEMIGNTQVFIQKKDIDAMLNEKDFCNEIIILSNDQNKAGIIANNLKSKNENSPLAFRTWKEVAPELAMMELQFEASQYIVRIIILAALIFGIINTLLMSVLERTKELGMMMAIGLNKSKTFSMVVIESLFLSIVSAPIGIGLSLFLIHGIFSDGLDLSFMADSFDNWGIDPIIMLDVDNSTYISMFILISITNILGAIYPGIKAIRLNPADSIN